MPSTDAAMKPSMNHGKATLRLPSCLTVECVRSHQMAMMMAANTSMSTRLSFMMVAMFRASSPKAPPTATAWAISCRLAPAATPCWAGVRPSAGNSAISISAKIVPMMATVATAITSLSAFSSSSSSGTVMEPDSPMTAAAPQMPVPPAVRMASIGLTLSARAIR